MGEMIPIVAIFMGCMIPITALWSRHKQKIAAMEKGIVLDDKGNPVAQAAHDSASQAEIRELRERVKVLERIVTDGGYNLASEIEQLRDARAESQQASGVPLNIETREKA